MITEYDVLFYMSVPPTSLPPSLAGRRHRHHRSRVTIIVVVVVVVAGITAHVSPSLLVRRCHCRVPSSLISSYVVATPPSPHPSSSASRPPLASSALTLKPFAAPSCLQDRHSPFAVKTPRSLEPQILAADDPWIAPPDLAEKQPTTAHFPSLSLSLFLCF